MIFLMDEVGHFLEFLGSNSGNVFFEPGRVLSRTLREFAVEPDGTIWAGAIQQALRTQETQVVRVRWGMDPVESQPVEVRIAACGIDRILASLLLIPKEAPLKHTSLSIQPGNNPQGGSGMRYRATQGHRPNL